MSAYTIKTYEEDDGFLHLRVGRKDGSVVELLLSDFAGEHFVRIREGTPVTEELEWTPRVDRFVAVLDAKAAVTPGEREVAVTRTQRLLYALQTSSTVHPSSQIKLVVAKDDAVGDEDREGLRSAVARLLNIARQVDPDAGALYVAARPARGTAPYGLDELLSWMCREPDTPTSLSPATPNASRAFARFRT